MAAQYIPHQVPLSSTHMTNLLNSIEPRVDPNIAVWCARISIESNGMWDNWEKAVEHLLPADPVVNKLSRKLKNVHLSGVTSLKKVVSMTGVELRFYKYNEFAALSDSQKEGIRELRPKGKGGNRKGKFGKGNGKGGVPTKGNNHWTKKQNKGKVAALVKEQLKK